MQIKEFSALTGIKRENLRYYDQIGLLSPEFRGKNGYRYYSQNQLTTAYLITSLREIGIGIEEIKDISIYVLLKKCFPYLAHRKNIY